MCYFTDVSQKLCSMQMTLIEKFFWKLDGKIFFSIISNLIIELSPTILVVSCQKRRAVTHLSLIFTSADTAKFCNHIILAEITLFAQPELWVLLLLHCLTWDFLVLPFPLSIDLFFIWPFGFSLGLYYLFVFSIH